VKIILDQNIKGSIQEQVKHALLNIINRKELINSSAELLKLSIFVNAESDKSFLEIKDQIRLLIEDIYSKNIPAITVISQPPLSGNDVLIESDWIKTNKHITVDRLQLDNHHYVIVTDHRKNIRKLFSGGISFYNSNDNILEYRQVFEFAEQLLKKENMNFGNIVRQWNYIPHILSEKKSIHGIKLQRYQIFNDIRSSYFDIDLFKNGYPAATGIGSSTGGITIDFIAVSLNFNNIVTSIRNPLQYNAYNYSSKVLEGDPLVAGDIKRPPLFERAKRELFAGVEHIYVSGTASIIGEKTEGAGNIKKQTEITINNILQLLASDNLDQNRIRIENELICIYARIYISECDELEEIKSIIKQKLGDCSMVFVKSDICRKDLLIEIEAEYEVKK
jgi:enamine deaminase RidA (YjgF/YER057c/UK114 family)